MKKKIRKIEIEKKCCWIYGKRNIELSLNILSELWKKNKISKNLYKWIKHFPNY